AELDAVGMALQDDLARGAGQAGVVLGDGGVLEVMVEVGVDNLLAVEDDEDLLADGTDGHGVPLAGGLAGFFAGADHVIDGAGVLVVVELGVAWVGIVENLDFHAD